MNLTRNGSYSLSNHCVLFSLRNIHYSLVFVVNFLIVVNLNLLLLYCNALYCSVSAVSSVSVFGVNKVEITFKNRRDLGNEVKVLQVILKQFVSLY